MSVKKKDELLNIIKNYLKDDTSDEAINLLSDISDTVDDYEQRTSDSTDWKTKYETNDAEWRKKYRDRFFNTNIDANNDNDNDTDVGDDETVSLTYESLFKEKE